MTRVLFTLLILCSALVQSATVLAEDVLRVNAGQTKTLAPEGGVLNLDRLVLEDKATLRIAPRNQPLHINVSRVEIGKDVIILATGPSGSDGLPGASQSGRAEMCKDALSGTAGSAGSDGGNGINLSLTWGVASLGSLTIDTSGGAGGNGGDGGQGQDAGEFDRCSSPPAGAGGAGGNGGNGGNGGPVSLVYRLLPGNSLTQPLEDLVTIKSGAGSAGNGGAGGQGGAGTDGKYINQRSLTGTRKWLPGASAGAVGSEGAKGASGADGNVLVQQDARDRIDAVVASPAPVVAPAASGLDAKVEQQAREIQDLRSKINNLSTQIQQLEAKVNEMSR